MIEAGNLIVELKVKSFLKNFFNLRISKLLDTLSSFSRHSLYKSWISIVPLLSQTWFIHVTWLSYTIVTCTYHLQFLHNILKVFMHLVLPKNGVKMKWSAKGARRLWWVFLLGGGIVCMERGMKHFWQRVHTW
jgi:hypothetical protein